MKKYLYSAALLILAAGCASLSPQDRLTVNDKKINKIIAQMTLEEKVEMLHSKTNMSSEGVPRLGIQDIKYTDGPFGIREENGDGFRSLGWTLDSATYFPTGSALAATWSKEMAYKNGWAMGKEGRLRGKDIILGPAINIQRLPVGGRTYEYLSEKAKNFGGHLYAAGLTLREENLPEFCPRAELEVESVGDCLVCVMAAAPV